jgi:hypothetical protein
VFHLLALTLALAADPSPDVVLKRDGVAEQRAVLAKRIEAAPQKRMTAAGLAGAMGEVRVTVTAAAPQEILLPIPQLADAQVPLAFFVDSTPPDAVTDFRLRTRDEGNVVLVVRLAGKRQEVRVAWSAVVLLAPREVTANATKPEPYRAATACVQAKADEVAKLAEQWWPKSGKADEFAANIQKNVAGLKRLDRPKSLDALGILKSGENGICTANANLAAAVMRAKGVACRSVAVIPPIGMKLEMHRTAEYHAGGRWHPFDPSSVTPDVPSKPWQNVIMSKTTVADEQAAMKPRMGVMVGCPYAQELELLTPGVNLFGADFFFTIAKPLAEFEPADEVAKAAAAAWAKYLGTGALTPAQAKAAAATTAADFAAALKEK